MFGGACGACMYIWCMYSYICLVFHIVFGDNPKPQFALFMLFMKSGTFQEKHLKSNKKQLIQHKSLILIWSFIKYRGKAN